MHKNQYLISTEKAIKLLPNYSEKRLGKLNIYIESSLPFHYKTFQNREIVILGIFFDPLRPSFSGESLLEKVIPKNADIKSFLKIIEKFSGRFVAIFRDNDSYFVAGDFKHSKKILYAFQDQFSIITSSLNLYYDLFKEKPNYNPKLKSFFESDLFRSKEQDWYGNKTVDVNFKKLLPNHYLNVLTQEISRIPFTQKKKSFDEVLEINFEILKGTYDYLINHHKIIQPITAGWDSRILLGASMRYKELIKYYIFRRPNNEESSDVILSQKISKALDLNFSVYDVEDFKPDFIAAYKSHNLLQNFLLKVRDIQYHYHNHQNVDKLINVSGVSGNLLRNVFGCTNRIVIDKKELHCLNPYGPYLDVTTHEIDLWYDDALDYAKSNNISLLDIFYIENRAANWGSIYPFEQDIALDEIDPFSNKSLMFPVLLLNSEYRGFGKNHLSWKLLERFDSSLCKFPFNPHRSAIRMFFYKKYYTNLLYKKLKFKKAKYFKKLKL